MINGLLSVDKVVLYRGQIVILFDQSWSINYNNSSSSSVPLTFTGANCWSFVTPAATVHSYHKRLQIGAHPISSYSLWRVVSNSIQLVATNWTSHSGHNGKWNMTLNRTISHRLTFSFSFPYLQAYLVVGEATIVMSLLLLLFNE